jgi:hypothetical protein
MNNNSEVNKKELTLKISDLIDELNQLKNTNNVDDFKRIQKAAKKIYDYALISRYVIDNKLDKPNLEVPNESGMTVESTNTDVEPDKPDAIDYGGLIIEGEEENNINESISNQDSDKNLAEKFQSEISLSINEKIYLTNALFDGSTSSLDKFLLLINTTHEKSNFENIFKLKAQELNWNEEDEAFRKLKKVCASKIGLELE